MTSEFEERISGLVQLKFKGTEDWLINRDQILAIINEAKRDFPKKQLGGYGVDGEEWYYEFYSMDKIDEWYNKWFGDK